jgi:hypothetical protein
MRRLRVPTPVCPVYLRVLVVEDRISVPNSGRRVRSRNNPSPSNNINSCFKIRDPRQGVDFLLVVSRQQGDRFPGFPGVMDAEDVGPVEQTKRVKDGRPVKGFFGGDAKRAVDGGFAGHA